MTPDVEAFNRDLIRHNVGASLDGDAVARVFRAFFTQDPARGRKVLFILLHWCGEYDTDVPTDPHELQQWAGKKQVAALIKAAMYADLDAPT